MSHSHVAVGPAAESAATVLANAGGRWEVLTRQGRTLVHRWWTGGQEERINEESGVACRVTLGQERGFAAASGRGAWAGRRAAEAALASRFRAPDPLPPACLLGSTPVPPAPKPATSAELLALGEALRQVMARYPGIEVLDLRVSSGEAHTLLLTSEAHVDSARVAGAAVEVLLAAAAGPLRLLRWAGSHLAHFDVSSFTEQWVEAVLMCSRGHSVARRLADVVLAPAAAAPLVLALVEHLQATRPHSTHRPARVAPAWCLVDERAGPEGLLPQPFDGEGVPSRSHRLLAEGQVGSPLRSWAEVATEGGEAGGAVRPSYRHPPRGGPANLVVHPTRPLATRDLLEQLEDGFWLDLPAGPAHIDPGGERFVLRAAAVEVAGGRRVSSYPLVELRGSFRRLLTGLAATGLDSQSFSLAAAVTTPSLLFRKLEIS